MSEKILVTTNQKYPLEGVITVSIIHWDSPDLIQALHTLARIREDEEITHIDVNSDRIMIGIRGRKDVE